MAESKQARKSRLIEQLAFARRARRLNKPPQGPQRPVERDESPTAGQTTPVPADGQRELADKCAKDAMIMGWERAIQKHAYENGILVREMEKILDEATSYNDKADPSGRIDELNDWKIQKKGRSNLAASVRRPS